MLLQKDMTLLPFRYVLCISDICYFSLFVNLFVNSFIGVCNLIMFTPVAFSCLPPTPIKPLPPPN